MTHWKCRARTIPRSFPSVCSGNRSAQARVAQAQALGFNPGIADRKRTGNVYWIDIDLKPTDTLINPSDLQGEAGRIVRLEVRGCPLSGDSP
jgi:hypothetical protein